MRTRLLAAAALAWGCLATPPPPPPPAPNAPAAPALARGQARIEGVRERGPYLEAHLVGNAGRQGFLFVASAGCRALLVEGATVRLLATPPLMTVLGANDTRCAARGIASLAEWRDALPARRSRYLVLREPAELALQLETPEFVIATGTLPLALELRWSNPLDVAVVLPNTPACRAHLARERTEVEFRALGEDPLVLRGRLDPCPVLALAENVFLN